MSEPSPVWPGPQLTPMQWRILGHVSSFIDSKGYGPSLSEIAQMTGLASKSTALHHVRRLVALGMISRDAGVARSIRVRMPEGTPHANIP
jgi:repressor LexA